MRQIQWSLGWGEGRTAGPVSGFEGWDPTHMWGAGQPIPGDGIKAETDRLVHGVTGASIARLVTRLNMGPAGRGPLRSQDQRPTERLVRGDVFSSSN